jgi:uncharacterized protein
MKRQALRKMLNLTVFSLVTLLVLFLGGLSWWYALLFVTPGSSQLYWTPDEYGLTPSEHTLTTSDGVAIYAWYVPPPPGSDRAIIYLHGQGSNRAHFLPNVPPMYEAGYGALMIDTRGHGNSEMVKRTMGVAEVADVRAATEFLLKQPEVNRVGVMGASMGASIGMVAAAQIPELEVIVALSPYSSLVDVVGDRAQEMYSLPPRPTADLVIWWMNLYTGYNVYASNPQQAATRISDRPVLVIHGTADPVIPVASVERIQAVAGDNFTFWIEEGVGHETDGYTRSQRMDELIAFVERGFAPGPISQAG